MKKQYYLTEKTGSLRGPFAGHELVSLLDDGVIEADEVIRDEQGRTLTAAMLEQIEHYKGNLRRNAGAPPPPQNPVGASEKASFQRDVSRRRYLLLLVDFGFISALFLMWLVARQRQPNGSLPWLAGLIVHIILITVGLTLWNKAVRSSTATNIER